MKRRRHSPEQIVRKLREANRLPAEGREVPEVHKELKISEATYHRPHRALGYQSPAQYAQASSTSQTQLS